MSSYDDLVKNTNNLHNKLDQQSKHSLDQQEKIKDLEFQTKMARASSDEILRNQKKELNRKQMDLDSKDFIIKYKKEKEGFEKKENGHPYHILADKINTNYPSYKRLLDDINLMI